LKEKKIYSEIPGGRNKFHSAILTSYSFSFHHFEYQILKTLKRKWIINVGLLIDSYKLDEVLGVSSGGLKQSTKSYSINGVKANGAFHPKINFLIGDKHLLLVLGSGNLTPGGQGKNHETFGALYADVHNSLLIPLLNEAYEYIKEISRNIDGYSSRRIQHSIPTNCEFLGSKIKEKHLFHDVGNGMELALLYNDDTSILSQLLNLIPQREVKQIRILSPYYDKNGELIIEFANQFQNANIEVYLPNDNGLPPVEIQDHARVCFYKWEKTRRAQKTISGPDSYDRKLHSKVFLFETEDTSFFMLGSANATKAAFGSLGKRGINDEFDLLYKTKKLDFFKELGIYGEKSLVKPGSLIREPISLLSSPENQNRDAKLVTINSCDLNNSTLSISMDVYSSEIDLNLWLCDDMGNIQHTKKISIQQKISVILSPEIVKKNLVFISIANDENKIVSNKQIINHLDRLYNTDPSEENRTITGVRNALEIGKLNEYQLLEYLNIIKVHRNQNFHRPTSSSTNDKTPEVNANMTYGEAMEASKNKKVEAKIVSQHSSVQFWQSISRLLKFRNESTQDTLYDEEEDGTAEESNDRPNQKDEVKRNFKVNKAAELNRILNKSNTIASNFTKAITNVLSDDQMNLNEISFCQILVVGHILTTIHHFEEYDLPKQNGDYHPYTPEEWSKKLQMNYSEKMILILQKFAQLCLKHNLVDTTDDHIRNEQIQKYKKDVLNHILLYHYFINNNYVDNPRVESTDLACLTIFNKLGHPTDEMIENLNILAKSDSEDLFDIRKIKRLNDRLKNLKSKIKDKKEYFLHPRRGVCIVKKTEKNYIFYTSVFNTNDMNKMKLSDHKKL